MLLIFWFNLGIVWHAIKLVLFYILKIILEIELLINSINIYYDCYIEKVGFWQVQTSNIQSILFKKKNNKPYT
jgi:hypothetical protein